MLHGRMVTIQSIPQRNLKQRHRMLHPRQYGCRTACPSEQSRASSLYASILYGRRTETSGDITVYSKAVRLPSYSYNLTVRLCSVQGRMVGHVTCLDVLWSTWAALDWRVEKLKINGIKIKIVSFEVLLFLSLNPTFWRKVTFLDRTYF